MKTIEQKLLPLFSQPWVIILLAFIIRVAFLARENLWLDEVVTYNEGLKPLGRILTERWDPHPPLYYLFLHYWLKLGQNDFLFRLPSAVFGALSVGVMLALAKRLYSRTTAVWLALLLAVTPVHLWFSQEARMYALLSLFSLLSTYYFVCLIQGEKRWVLYTAFTLLGLYTQYTMGLVVLGQNLFITAYWLAHKNGRQQISLPYWLLTQISLVILYIPWMPQLPAHWDVMRFSEGYPLQPLTTPPFLAAMGLAVLLTWLGVIAWFKIDWSPQARKRMLTVAFIGCSLVYIALCILYLGNRAVTAKRQSFVLFPLLCMILYSSFTIWRHKSIFTVGFVVVSLGFSIINTALIQKPRWQELVTAVEQADSEQDVLIFNPPFIATPYQYYATQQQSVYRFNRSAADEAESSLTQYERIWLITNLKFEPWEDPNYVVRSWLQAQYQQDIRYDYGELEVLRFTEDSTD